MATLKGLKARQVLDSRGRPTVEVEAIATCGAVGRAIVPSGASTGRHEAIELRDAESPRYGGLGVLKAVDNVTRLIAPAVAGIDLDDQAGLDARLIALDGTPNKGRLGANALLGVSLAVAHAAAAARGEELFVHLNRLWNDRTRSAPASDAAPTIPTLPLPMVNMISGGLHAGGNLDIQDVLIVPVGASSYGEALERERRAVSRRRRSPQGCGLRVGARGRRGRLRAAAPRHRAGLRDASSRRSWPAASSRGGMSRSPWTWPRPTSSTRSGGPTG